MNPENYGSLEACQRLVDAGIVLETECVWAWMEKPAIPKYEKPCLYVKEQLAVSVFDRVYPAPSMAEVWRELPMHLRVGGGHYSLILSKSGKETQAGYWQEEVFSQSFYNLNPIDALIDLLIWVRSKKS